MNTTPATLTSASIQREVTITPENIEDFRSAPGPFPDCTQLIWCVPGPRLDRSVLAKFPNIRILECQNCNLTTLEELADLCLKIQQLYCFKNCLRSLLGIGHLKYLELLQCSDNFIENLEELLNCLLLNALYCSGNRIDNFESLRLCSLLTFIAAHNNKLGSLVDLQHLPLMKNLGVSGNCIRSLKGVEFLKNLESFCCQNNSLTSVKELLSLPNLKSVMCSINNSDLSIAEQQLLERTRPRN